MKTLLLRLRALFPSRLPTGVSAFNDWAESFYEIYEMPTTHRESVKFVLASTIMHLGPTAIYKSKFYFYLVLSTGAAKQVAGSIFYDIKEAQKKAESAAANVQATGS